MKAMKKALALILTLAIVMSLGITAFAEVTKDYSFTITNEVNKTNITLKGSVINAYRVFDVDYSDMPNADTDSKAAYTYTVNPAFKGKKGTGADDTIAPLTWKASDNNTYKAGTDEECTALINYLQNNVENNSADAYSFTKAVNDYIAAHNKLDTSVAEKQRVDFAPVTVAGVYSDNSAASPNAVTETISFESDDAGYYVVVPVGKSNDANALAIVAGAALDTTNNKFTIPLKAQAPKLEKTVDGNVDTTANVGDVVTFELKTTVPNMAGYPNYSMVFHDTLSAGLTIDKDSFTVKVGETTITNTEADTYYSVAYDNVVDDNKTPDLTDDIKETLALTIKDLVAVEKTLNTAHAGTVVEGTTPITITYQAKVNADAVKTLRDQNKAILEYFSDPYHTGMDPKNPEDPEGEKNPPKTNKTPEEVTYLYNFDMDVDKFTTQLNPNYNAEDPSTGDQYLNVKLEDAQFMLYRLVKKDLTDDGVNNPTDVREYYQISTTDKSVAWIQKETAAEAKAAGATVAYTKFTDENKDATKLVAYPDNDASQTAVDIKFQGLKADTYYVEEVASPNGYNMLKKPVTVKITPTFNTTTGDANEGRLEKVTYKITYTDNQGGTNAVEKTYTVDSNAVNAGLHLSHAVPVENKAGSELPTTGGVGTAIFYTVGAILMASALVLLITKKKVSAN